MALSEEGFLEERHIRMLGTGPESIKMAEDRQSFKETMEAVNQPCIASEVVHTAEAAVALRRRNRIPRDRAPGYTLGGTGGGIAKDEAELREIASGGLRMSRVGQVPDRKGNRGLERDRVRGHAGTA
jgi:carbamoyl-phosphate synthase large subunit